MDHTTHVIPKKDTASVQRWKLDNLDKPKPQNPPEPSQVDQPDKVSESPANTEPEKQPTPALPTAEQINHVYQQAQEDGYSAGFQAGRAAGYQEGKQAADSETKNEIKRIQLILAELDQELHQIDQDVAQDLLTLALDLAKTMIKNALQIQPELVLPIVREAIGQLPHAAQHPRLFLHPDDALLVSHHLNDELSQADWKICQDEKIERGGCRIEASGSEVDGSLSTRWQQVLAKLGQENNWLK